MNPIRLVRRLLGLGAMAVVLMIGAKSWLDAQRAELRWDYYQDVAEFWETAAGSVCLSRDAVVDTAMTRRWVVREATEECGGNEAVRLISKAQTPWIPGARGFVVQFDGEGCGHVVRGCQGR